MYGGVKVIQIFFSGLGGGGALALQKPPKWNAFERGLPQSGCAPATPSCWTPGRSEHVKVRSRRLFRLCDFDACEVWETCVGISRCGCPAPAMLYFCNVGRFFPITVERISEAITFRSIKVTQNDGI